LSFSFITFHEGTKSSHSTISISFKLLVDSFGKEVILLYEILRYSNFCKLFKSGNFVNSLPDKLRNFKSTNLDNHSGNSEILLYPADKFSNCLQFVRESGILLIAFQDMIHDFKFSNLSILSGNLEILFHEILNSSNQSIFLKNSSGISLILFDHKSSLLILQYFLSNFQLSLKSRLEMLLRHKSSDLIFSVWNNT
jgi:hypothetical protein